MKLSRKISRCWREWFEMLLPRRCCVCGRILHTAEEHICVRCYMKLPFTRWRGRPGNGMERIFWARIPIERANALLHYYGGDESRKIVLALKYRNRPQVGIYFGRIMAADLRDTRFFDGIDAIVPIPLAKKRESKRGYNQSLMLAKGVSEITGLPILDNVVERTRDNPSQTRLSATERKDNVIDVFSVKNSHLIRHKHLLVVDDVLTTGSTIMACAMKLAEEDDVCISILTLFIAGRHGDGPTL